MILKKVTENILMVWPKCLNTQLIEKFHSYEQFFHISGNKLKSTLSDKFLIQGYHKDAAIITANCSFCNLRVNLPKQKRPNGVMFELKIPFTMWAIDYVILDSRWSTPAALTLEIRSVVIQYLFLVQTK